MERFAARVAPMAAGRTVVTAVGELDLANADEFWAQLEPLLTAGHVVVVDSAGLTFLDSSGLRVLLRAAVHASANAGAFRLAAPQAPVQRVLDLAGTGAFLQTCESVREALVEPAPAHPTARNES